MRVLAVARTTEVPTTLPESVTELHLQYVGLVGFADPLRPSVPEAVRQCRAAGIRVIMITGDHAATARSVANQAGIASDRVVIGDDVETLDETALCREVSRTSVFARIKPAQKLRIVDALRVNGEVVAMTGDGVNDAPALKSAHIGIAMGGRGTDVAREAAALILLDDEFGSIVKAVRLGRRIYDNLRKAIAYILAIHLPIAVLALLPVLMGQPLILTPLLIALLELLIDPACSIVLEAEAEERDIMQRAPRDPRSPLLPRALIRWSVIQGSAAAVTVTAAFLWGAWAGHSQAQVRTFAFLTLVGVNLALVVLNRTFSSSWARALKGHNRVLGPGVALVAMALTALVSVPRVRDFFGLASVTVLECAASLALALGLLVVLESIKRRFAARLAR